MAQGKTITGTENIDTLYGDSGNDIIKAYGGDDKLYGRGGNDILYGGSGNDTIYGEAGDDVIYSGLGSNTLDGGAGVDTVDYSGAEGAIKIDFDYSYSYLGALKYDYLTDIENAIGSKYNDIFWSDNNSNTFDGGLGNDTFYWYSGGQDTFKGSYGVDTVSYYYRDGGVIVNLHTGKAATGDTLEKIENVDGSDYNDVITGNALANVLNGGSGKDDLRGNSGNDILNGGSGNDILSGGNGNDRLKGGEENDKLYGGQGTDTLYGEAGNDIFYSGLDANTLHGGLGIDTANYAGATSAVTVNLENHTARFIPTSGNYADTLYGIETIVGTTYNDSLRGDNQANKLYGGAGDDSLYAKSGRDTLIGGAGHDTFAFEGTTTEVFYIDDFISGEDKIDVSGLNIDKFSDIDENHTAGGKYYIDLGNKNVFVNTDLQASDFIFA